ncbi:hypothetical protein V8G61_08790 [Gaetbulibacter sp. M240]|uniref:hypothetical protein n=1 Tax=Gaetbulibacter sp. M240 TaxID=3126511 RepID=UPI00374F0BAD
MPQNITFSLYAIMDESTIVTSLIIVVIFFAILLILGIRKSYLLKKENERLDAINKQILEDNEENKPYRDFTEGHLYGNDNK